MQQRPPYLTRLLRPRCYMHFESCVWATTPPSYIRYGAWQANGFLSDNYSGPGRKFKSLLPSWLFISNVFGLSFRVCGFKV